MAQLYSGQRSIDLWKTHLATGLREDQWHLDWTTWGVNSDHQRSAKAMIVSKQDQGVWAAEGLFYAARDVAKELGFQFECRELLEDGSLLRRGTQVVVLEGDAGGLLILERTLLNLASFVSGIATQTRELVDRVAAAGVNQGMASEQLPRVTATRKTLPGYRDLSLYGVLVGGGFSHRVNLAGGVLIKENHLACAGSISKAIQGVRRVAPHLLGIEIEVKNQGELEKAVQAGAEIVMLDNYSPDAVRKALDWVKTKAPHLKIEVSGGISRDNIADYVQPGVHVLSCGGLTHSVKSLDLSLLFQVA